MASLLWTTCFGGYDRGEGDGGQSLRSKENKGWSTSGQREKNKIGLKSDRFEVLRENGSFYSPKFHLGGFLRVCNKTLAQ